MEPVRPYKTTYHHANAYWMARFSGEVYTKVSDNDYRPDEEKILASLKRDDE